MKIISYLTVLVLSWNRTLKKDFIEFRNGIGCYSFAGRDGGRQDIILSSYCAEEHTLVHEVYFVIIRIFRSKNFQILHALGLLHEHQRPDRDQYITVNMTAATYYGRYQQLRKACFLEFRIRRHIWRPDSGPIWSILYKLQDIP